MKIKNVALSLAGLTAVTIGLSQLNVLAADEVGNVKMDLTNAIQHIINVKLIGGGTDSATLKNAGSRLLGIETDNFILSKDDATSINKIDNSSSSNILGGVSNKINEGEASTILGGQNNVNNRGKYSTILGGKYNKIDEGQYSTMVGGYGNTEMEGNYLKGDGSVIVGGTKNKVDGNFSAVLGSNAKVEGNNSVALGNNSQIDNVNNSFLWTDGNQSPLESLPGNEISNVFVVNSAHGMVVNTNVPHSFAQLTIGGSLVVNKGNDDVSCDSDHIGVLKVVNPESGTSNHICFCSCNGDGYWHSLYGQGRCEGKCNPGNEKPAGCGEKYAVCGNSTDGFRFVGSCNANSKPVTGEGAYFVDYEAKVHWTCQTDAGITGTREDEVVQCVSSIRDNTNGLCNG